MNLNSILLTALFLFTTTHLIGQQVYQMQGKILEVNELVKKYDIDEALRQIDSLSQETDTNLSKKEALEYQLELQLLKAKVYDENFELELALTTLLPILDQSRPQKLYKITTRAYLLLASVKQKGNDLEESETYQKLALEYIQRHQFDDLYGAYYYNLSGWQRLKNEPDQVLKSAEKILFYGEKYKNEEDIALGHTMLGMGYGPKKEFRQAINHYKKVIPYYKKTGNYTSLAMMYRNISRNFFLNNEIDSSFHYIDSAYIYYDDMSYFYKEYLPLKRLDLYAHIGKWDSAFHYLSDFHNLSFYNVLKRESSKIKGITEQFDNDKKEAVIKSKEQQVYFTGSLLAVIILGTVLLIRKNRQINRQNKIISTQLGELTKTLEQKQVLLSELQHRVKNNLQHVISILEIQKESVDFNNIDELIRGNQNRIHSMALLHKKLNVLDNADEVDLERYVTELAGLVKESYENHKKQIRLNIKCEVEKISIEKALPLGLIITELVSNTMKHAFKKRNVGIINIEIKREGTAYQLYYSDNGVGFDFNKPSEKGLGQEIIKGLIDQLDGVAQANSDNGFELFIQFKG